MGVGGSHTHVSISSRPWLSRKSRTPRLAPFNEYRLRFAFDPPELLAGYLPITSIGTLIVFGGMHW